MKKTMVVMFLLGAMLGVAQGQQEMDVYDGPSGWDLSLYGGAAIPAAGGFVEDIGGDLGSSPLMKASLMRQANPYFGIGIETGFVFNQQGDFHRSALNAYIPIEYERSVFQLTPELQIGPWLGPVRPYLTFGGGLYRIEEDIRAGWATEHLTNSYGGINGGAGVLFQVSDRLSMGPDFRYHRILTSDDDFHYMDATLRLALRF